MPARPIRIAVIAPQMGNPRAAASTRYGALRAAAARRGHVVRFLASPFPSAAADDIVRIPVRAPDNRASLPRRALLEVYFGIVAGFNAELRRADVVLIGLPEVITGLVIGALLRLRRIPYVLDVRDAYPAVYIEAGLLAEGSLLLKLMSGWLNTLYRRARGSLAATEGIRRAVVAVGVAEESTRTVRNGYTAGVFEPRPAPPAPADGRLTIGIHGTLGRFQNVEALAALVHEARRRHLGWNFIVVGDGPSASILESVEPGADFTWKRGAPQRELAELISNCHVALSLRTADWIGESSLPVRVFEYIGLGVPVVLYPPSEAGAIVEEMGFGSVVTTDAPDALIGAVRALAEPARNAATRASILGAREQFRADLQWDPWLASLEARPTASAF